MTKTFILVLAALLPCSLFAVDGQKLINLSTVMAAGGFPYVISQPGSYKLSDNLTAPPETTAINLAADGITLDLNGFTVQCSVTLPNTVKCINATVNNIEVRNGVVKGLLNGGTTSDFGLAHFVGLYLVGERNKIEDLRVDVPITNPVLSGAIYRSITVGPSSLIRHNVFNGSGFVTCPSTLLVENVSENVIVPWSVSSCPASGNAGFF